MDFRRQTMCLIALLSACTVVNDFDFVEGDAGLSDAAADGLELDGLELDGLELDGSELDGSEPDASGLDTGGLDAGGLDVLPPPLLLTGLSLMVDEETVVFGTPFAPTTMSYDDAEVGFFVREVTLVATTDLSGVELSIGDNTIVSGESAPIELSLGDNTVTVTLARGDERTSYSLELDRDDELQNSDYIKSDPVAVLTGFGRSIAMAGDLLVIGAPGERVDGQLQAGAAYFFQREESSWSFVQRVEGAGKRSGAFGGAVSTDGNLIAIGASGETSSEVAGAGAVYVYREFADSRWIESQRLTHAGPMELDRFGVSVALEGRTLAVGARGADAVFSFELGESWTLNDTLRPPAGIPADAQFGSAIVMRGDTLVVAANGEDAGGAGGVNPVVAGASSNSGAAFVYQRDGTSWISPAYLKAFGPQASDRFGSAIALDGNLLAVGATDEDSNANGVGTTDDPGVGESNSGAVYTFRRAPDGAWVEENYIKAETPVINGEFGGSLAMRGNLLFVGEPDGSTAVGNSGNVSLYVHGASGWNYEDLSVSPRSADLDGGDLYGVSIGVSAHGLVAGASSEDGDGSVPGNNGLSSSGAAYSFEPTP